MQAIAHTLRVIWVWFFGTRRSIIHHVFTDRRGHVTYSPPLLNERYVSLQIQPGYVVVGENPKILLAHVSVLYPSLWQRIRKKKTRVVEHVVDTRGPHARR